jgi:hypothetical protein
MRGGDGEVDITSIVVVVPDSDDEIPDIWESASDRYSDSISDIRNSMGVGEAVSDGGAVSDDVSDVDIDTRKCTLGRGGSLLMVTELEGVGRAVAGIIAGVDNDIACLCRLIWRSEGKAVSG